jgi:molybdopterin converting factor small subunit
MATVRIPTQMRSLVGGASSVEVEGDTVGGVLRGLAETHQAIAPRLFEDDGRVRRFVNVFLENEDIRFADGLDTKVAPGQTISLLPAVAGGAR